MLIALTDAAVTDLLRGLFEAHDCLVAAASTVRGCAAIMDRQPIDAVITTWDDPLGRHLHAWTLDHHRELRRRFVFVIDDDAAAAGVSGRERTVRLADLARLLEEVTSLAGARLAAGTPVTARQRLLLVGDDDLQLDAMSGLLGEMGFAVTTASGVGVAAPLLESARFDVVLCDWGGSGDALYTWMNLSRPELLSRLVLMTDADIADVQLVVGDVPVVPKGQDSSYLLAELTRAGGAE